MKVFFSILGEALACWGVIVIGIAILSGIVWIGYQYRPLGLLGSFLFLLFLAIFGKIAIER